MEYDDVNFLDAYKKLSDKLKCKEYVGYTTTNGKRLIVGMNKIDTTNKFIVIDKNIRNVQLLDGPYTSKLDLLNSYINSGGATITGISFFKEPKEAVMWLLEDTE